MPRSFEPIPKTRKNGILVLCFLSFLLIFSQYFNLQVLQHEKHTRKSKNNSLRKLVIPAPRGIIYDRNGQPLVDNMPIFEVKVRPVDVTDNFDYDVFSKELELDIPQIKSYLDSLKHSGGKFNPNLIKRHLEFSTISRLEENRLELPGIVFSELPARIYPSQAKLSHTLGYLRTVTTDVLKSSDPVLGYLKDDIYGAAGLESYYESSLRGHNGFEYHLVDNRGIDHGLFLDEIRQAPVKGNVLNLTIDHDMQVKVEALLDGYNGAIICSIPETGEILAISSAPDYPLNSFIGPIPVKLWNSWNDNESKPLFNRSVNGLYPPGSTLKLVAAAMVMETPRIHENWQVMCDGSYRFGNRTYHCWKLDGHGSLNLLGALKHSCNIYFYQLIQNYNLAQWGEFAQAFGFGEKTGIDIPFESIGLIPDKKYLNEKYTSRGWSTGNLLSFVLGQGDVLATPLQVLHMVNLIAADGVAGTLHLNADIQPELDSLHVKRKTIKFLKKAMYTVVNGDKGTGENAKIPGIGKVYGKTGTAENPQGEPHSWFTGFIELENDRKMSLCIIIENGGKGSLVAAPIARQIFELFAEKDHVQASI